MGATVTWQDRFGEFPLRVGFEAQRAAQLAAPVSESFLTLHNRSRETVTVCGPAEAPQTWTAPVVEHVFD